MTLSTVGYGDISPVTPEGRIAAGALMVLGITLWAAITGTITSLLMMASSGQRESATDQIRSYGELMRDGLLTEDEFRVKKAELLSSP